MIEDYDIIDPELSSSNWKKGEGITFKQILMNQVATVSRIGSAEPVKGFWKSIPMRTGVGSTMMQEIYVTDKRREYISAIQVLFDLLLPRFDKDMNEKYKELEKKIKNKKKDYADKKRLTTDWADYERRVYREIFQQLILLISRLGYFEEEAISG